MTDDQHCTNCAVERGSEGECKHDNIERILAHETEQPCPFWFPRNPGIKRSTNKNQFLSIKTKGENHVFIQQ